MIKSIFFARFHPKKGPTVAYQVPAGSVIAASKTDAKIQADAGHAPKPLVDFALVSTYVVPPQALCNRLLTLRSPTSPHLIVSHPVCIVDNTRYDRNEFIFNFGVVLADKELKRRHGMVEAWKRIIRKIANVLRELEQEKQWLSQDEEALENGRIQELDSRVYALCEMVMEDLSCYGECMIPIDDTTTLSLRLFPQPRAPIPAHAWHVPVLLVNTSVLDIETWDLTLQLLLPYIDGVNYVRRIAELADADLELAREAIKALVNNGCAVLLDIFSFSASYAPTPEIIRLVEDDEGLEEARKYVLLPGYEKSNWYKEDVVKLLCSLKQGLRLRDWVLDRREQLAGVDVRRLITFGVIKGFIYRVHKYAISPQRSAKSEQATDGDVDKVRPYIDGLHCLDQACTELRMSDKDFTAAIKSQDAILIHR